MPFHPQQPIFSNFTISMFPVVILQEQSTFLRLFPVLQVQTHLFRKLQFNGDNKRIGSI